MAAALYENEVALVVHRDNKGALYLSGLRIETDSTKIEIASDQASSQASMIRLLGTSHPLPDYPNSLSIVKQSDGAVYGIVCTTQGSPNQASELSAGIDLILVSTVFRLDSEHGLVKVISTGGTWNLDRFRKSLSQTNAFD